MTIFLAVEITAYLSFTAGRKNVKKNVKSPFKIKVNATKNSENRRFSKSITGYRNVAKPVRKSRSRTCKCFFMFQITCVFKLRGEGKDADFDCRWVRTSQVRRDIRRRQGHNRRRVHSGTDSHSRLRSTPTDTLYINTSPLSSSSTGWFYKKRHNASFT